MGTVLSSFGTENVGGEGVGGGTRKRADGATTSPGILDGIPTSKHDDCGDVVSPPTPPIDSKQSPSTRAQYPCSNCHSMVASDQVRCSNCHGIQVKILHSPSAPLGNGSSPPNFVYLERVVSPRSATPSASAVAAGKASSPATVAPPEPILHDSVLLPTAPLNTSDDATKAKQESFHNDDDEESVASDYYDNDGMEDVVTLEASPRPSDFVVVGEGEFDELRPMNPVAATLASVPSPLPVPLKLEASATSEFLPSLSSSLMAAATVLPEDASGDFRDGGVGVNDDLDKKRPALAEGVVFSDKPLSSDDSDQAIQLMPSKKKLRMS